MDKRAWVQLASSQGPSFELDYFSGPFGEANMIFFFFCNFSFLCEKSSSEKSFKGIKTISLTLKTTFGARLKFRLPSDAAMLHTSSVATS